MGKRVNDDIINRINMLKISGYSNSQISRELNVDVKTIKKYIGAQGFGIPYDLWKLFLDFCKEEKTPPADMIIEIMTNYSYI